MKMTERLGSPWAVLDALDAMRHWKAVVLEIATSLLAILCFITFASMNFGFMTFMGTLFALAILFYGMNAVGIMLMDATRCGELPSVKSVLLRSLLTSHRLLLVFLFALLGFVVVAFADMLMLMTGKIPALGPLLAVVTTPVSAIALGLICFGLAVVVFPLASVAVWSGETVLKVFAILYAIFRQRFFAVFLQQLLLVIVVGFVCGLIMSLLFTGSLFTVLLSIPLFTSSPPQPFGVGGMDVLGNMGGGFLGTFGPLLAAGGAGLGMMFWVGLTTVPGLILVQGMCQIYLSALTNLDLDAAEAELKGGLAQAQRKMDEVRKAAAPEAAHQRATKAAQAAQTEAPVARPPCQGCGMAVEAGDVFCGNCGHRVP